MSENEIKKIESMTRPIVSPWVKRRRLLEDLEKRLQRMEMYNDEPIGVEELKNIIQRMKEVNRA